MNVVLKLVEIFYRMTIFMISLFVIIAYDTIGQMIMIPFELILSRFDLNYVLTNVKEDLNEQKDCLKLILNGDM